MKLHFCCFCFLLTKMFNFCFKTGSAPRSTKPSYKSICFDVQSMLDSFSCGKALFFANESKDSGSMWAELKQAENSISLSGLIDSCLASVRCRESLHKSQHRERSGLTGMCGRWLPVGGVIWKGFERKLTWTLTGEPIEALIGHFLIEN